MPLPLTFPTFLVPSLPFRRKDSTSSESSTSSISTTASGTSASLRYLNGHTSYLRCARCATDVCLTSQIISKGFTGRHGRAFLVDGQRGGSGPQGGSGLVNTRTHRPHPRHLVTGAHTVSDISCSTCGAVLGWKYVAAEEEAQRYKVGKFILETRKVKGVKDWEAEEPDELATEGGGGGGMVEFDSGDEEECEDLFSGVWSPALARRRRKLRQTVEA